MEGSEAESDLLKRPQFGTRHLSDPENVFQHNAWDNVEWGPDQVREAEEKLKLNSSSFLVEEEAQKFDQQASQFWDTFYSQHNNKFFKDRHWLFTELPELSGADQSSLTDKTKELPDFPGKSADFRILEVGCGVGNTVFPLLEATCDKNRFVYCCDFSSKAIDIVKKNSNYDVQKCHAFVSDISSTEDNFPFPESSLDIILLIFVMSAITPEKIPETIKKLSSYLKPGGRIFFRDYGRYDMAELRFKPGRCISEHFYVRGDGTRVYFFSQEELKEMFEQSGLVEEQNIADRRLLVNRGRQLTMYRVWLQCKYRKPLENRSG